MATYAFQSSPLFAQWVKNAPLAELGPGKRLAKDCAKLVDCSLTELFAPAKITNRTMAEAARSGLLLLYDGLNESHTISQENESATGSYWHAIMHRREPDYGNAKYWFRRVGAHPVFDLLAQRATELAKPVLDANPWPAANWISTGTNWSASGFVDLCSEIATANRKEHVELCKLIQRAEIELLLDYCFKEATR